MDAQRASQPPSERTVEGIRARHVLAETPGVVGIDAVRLRWIGHRLHAEVAVVVDHHSAVAHHAASGPH